MTEVGKSNATLRSLSAQKGKVFRIGSTKDAQVRGPLPSTTSLVNNAWKNKEMREQANPTGIFRPMKPKQIKPAMPPKPVAKSAEEPKKPKLRPNRNEMAVFGAGALGNAIGSVAVDEVKDVRRAGFFLPKQAKTLRWARPLRAAGMAGMVAGTGMAAHRWGKETKQQKLSKPIAKSVDSLDKFTRTDKKQLDRKRAINPVVSGAAAGTSLAALGANVGGLAMRSKGQQKIFNDKTGDYQWVDRPGASAKKLKLARMGSKLQAKALPTSLVAGGIGAAAALNGIQMSHLWNKKDKVYTHVKNDVKKSYDPYRRRKSETALATGGGAGLGAAGVFAGMAGKDAYEGVQTRRDAKGRVKAANSVYDKAFRESFNNGNTKKAEDLGAAARKLNADSLANIKASNSKFLRAGKLGAAAAGLGAVGAVASVAANRKRKDRMAAQVYRRRSWNEPLLGGYVSKGLLPMPIEMLLKKITDPEKRRRIRLGLQGKGPKLSDRERTLLMTIAGTVGSVQGIQAMGLMGTPDAGPEFYRQGIKKSVFAKS